MPPIPLLPLLPPPELEPAAELEFMDTALPEHAATMSAQIAVAAADVTSRSLMCLFTISLPFRRHRAR